MCSYARTNVQKTLESHCDQSVTPPLSICLHTLFLHDTLSEAGWEGVPKKRLARVNLDTCCHHRWQTVGPSHLFVS